MSNGIVSNGRVQHPFGCLASAASLCFFGALCYATPAKAYEDKLLVGLDTGLALTLGETEVSTAGVTAGARVAWGIDDAWSLRGLASWSYHPRTPDMHAGIVGSDVIYQLDILRLVPYFGLGADLFITSFEGPSANTRELSPRFGLHATLGLDFLLTPSWVLGVEARGYFLPVDFFEDKLLPGYFSATASLRYAFDLF